ncbi:hypothetical protein GCM10010339_85040 [Streptomyces alanosinicus]|uniref:Uncharacterized protein n=1 Tax=Streptomyces alanosinicus TaxID=68171 RepID=A0A919D7G1_9ACTN|nr:hypothetical protein GCM10010339_85040 [Streptomyces alanosinicus]
MPTYGSDTEREAEGGAHKSADGLFEKTVGDVVGAPGLVGYGGGDGSEGKQCAHCCNGHDAADRHHGDSLS